MYVTFCCLQGKTIRTKCILKVAFSLNSWIYNKKVIIQLTTIPKYIWTSAQMTTILDEPINIEGVANIHFPSVGSC